ncbi:hypothetical protein [Gordonia soli]|uniref:Uncharacterized protein n=1 Tax=Gordonia soli NBRC 108243 TaxID=1223545 RepID=M0QLQ8_9ACTN|nr:hypothetical protein [Gordonia soli]GAC69241.1 hypothetical protein GS4_23_00360 [Gordonia soli NBRC 108243]
MQSTKAHLLIDDHRRLAVLEERGPRTTTARLLIDDDEVGQVSGTMWDTKTIELEREKVRIRFGRRREVTRAELMQGADDVVGGVWFEPPAGTSAHRLWRLREEHPGAYAARRVVTSVVGAVAAVFGIGALVKAVVERLVPAIDLPAIDMPSVDLPDWMRYLNPGYWLRAPIEMVGSWIPNVDLALPSWTGIAVPVVISIALAYAEARRQRARRERQQSTPDSDRDVAGGDDENR